MKTNAPTTRKTFWEANRKSNGYLLRKKITQWTVSILRGLLLFGLCFMIIQPLLTRFGTSLMAEKDLYDSTVVLVPRNPTLDNYRIVFDLTDFPRSMLNTLWTSLLVSVLQVIACVIVLIIVPPQTIATALYMNFANFDIFGIFKATTGKTLSLHGSMIPYTLMSLTCMGLKDGLYIFMLRQYFRGIPKSLEEAAYVDGCSTLHTFVKIMLPDAWPTIMSCFLFSFVWQWTDLFYTRNFLSSMSIYSTQLSGIVARMNRYFSSNSNVPVITPVGRQQQLISIGVLVCCIPLLILYLFTQRVFVESIVMSGSKE